MAHVVTDLDTTAPPGAVINAITDFSPKRFELWPNVDRKFFKLEASADTSADVIEGSPAVWERNHYDWSRPDTVRIDVKDSNAFKAGSFWVYQVTPRTGGGSHVHMEFDRRPKNLKGYLLSAIIDLFGRKLFGSQLRQTLRQVEAAATPEPVPPKPNV
jgi:hypothetical protein